MTWWELLLLVLGCLALGWVGGIVSVWAYARHVYHEKVGELIDGAASLTATGHVEPPPPR
jgi:hypothetical protein